MGSTTVSPDMDASVFICTDSPAESQPPKTEKFRTSISVSSLAEKFEKGDSVKGEEDSEIISENQMEINIVENNDSATISADKAKNVIARLENKNGVISDDTLKKVVPSNGEVVGFQAEFEENGTQDELKASNAASVSSEVRYENDLNKSAASGHPTPENITKGEFNIKDIYNDSSEIITNAQISKAVEEKVAYFAERISKASQQSVTTAATNLPNVSADGEITSSVDQDKRFKDIISKMSLKDLENSFLTALHMTNAKDNEIGKSLESLSVPRIQITEASDREDSTSEEAEEAKSPVDEKEVEIEKANMEKESDTKQTDGKEPTPSTSTSIPDEKKNESQHGQEERKAFFYISSSDLPRESKNDFLENSDELRQRSVNVEDRPEPEIIRPCNNEVRSPSCLWSKSVHGIIFMVSFVVAIFGFILYSLGNERKVPDFCEHLGLVTAIIAGIIGAFSCFCYSVLEAFPRVKFAKYEKLVDTGKTSACNESKTANTKTLDDDSCSSEKELAVRRQNGMSSNDTSAASVKNDCGEFLMIKQSDQKELVEKTKRLKKEVVGILDSFSEMMSKLKPTDECADLEAGLPNGY